MSLPSPTDTLDLMRARRTVKPPLYDGRPVPDAVLDALLEAASWAPTHGMNQPWRFRVFTGSALARLENHLAAMHEAITPPEARRADKLAAIRRNARDAGAAVAVFVDRSAPGKIPFQEDAFAVACAVQNLMLAARAHGVGAFWSTNTVDYRQPPVARFPGAAATETYLGVVFLGYPRGEFPSSSRKPVSDFAVRER